MPMNVDLSYAQNTPVDLSMTLCTLIIDEQITMYDVNRWGAIPDAKFIAEKQEIDYLQITKDIARS